MAHFHIKCHLLIGSKYTFRDKVTHNQGVDPYRDWNDPAASWATVAPMYLKGWWDTNWCHHASGLASPGKRWISEVPLTLAAGCSCRLSGRFEAGLQGFWFWHQICAGVSSCASVQQLLIPVWIFFLDDMMMIGLQLSVLLKKWSVHCHWVVQQEGQRLESWSMSHPCLGGFRSGIPSSSHQKLAQLATCRNLSSGQMRSVVVNKAEDAIVLLPV